MLLPILLVWGVSFHAFDLYRPRRIGSHLSEAADLAKASTMGALVLVAVMAFFFKRFEYSRVVIIYFWLLSIGLVWFSRAAFREALRFARRRGYNLRGAVIIGTASWSWPYCSGSSHDPTWASTSWAWWGTDKGWRPRRAMAGRLRGSPRGPGRP